MTVSASEVLVFTTPTLMTVALFLHIAGGAFGIAAGYTALAVRKGATAHRAAGTVFFVAMLLMAGFASMLGAARGQTGNAIAGAFTVYLVATAWLAVRRPEGRVGRLEVFGFLFVSAVAAVSLLAPAEPQPDSDAPAGAVVVFGLVALLAALADLKVILQRGVSGAARISRHLWRMCAALFVATGSFFLGQMDVIPASLQGPHLWVLALAPLVLMVFWLIRVRIGRAFKAAPAAA